MIMKKRLSTREIKILSIAVRFGWWIYAQEKSRRGYWDGNKILPVNIGPIVNGLVKQGYMEVINKRFDTYCIRATTKARKLNLQL